MGVPHLQDKIVCIMDMMDLDEGRLPEFCMTNEKNGGKLFSKFLIFLYPNKIYWFIESKNLTNHLVLG